MKINTDILTYEPYSIVCEKDTCLWVSNTHEQLSGAVLEYGTHLRHIHTNLHEKELKQPINLMKVSEVIALTRKAMEL